MAVKALAELGMRSDTPPRKSVKKPAAKAEPVLSVVENPTAGSVEVQKDYFVERNGVKFAGTHLLIDLWGATNLNDIALTEKALVDAAKAADATVLHVHLHHFSPNGGISGVVVLAESHISIHTWPERDYAAIDIFMCGSCDPYKSIPVLREAFRPASVQFGEQRRGLFL
jgi:S-adenosylmethionine decarboxylase